MELSGITVVIVLKNLFRKNKTILVEALGKYNVNSVCPTVMVYLNGKKIEFLLEEAGSYKLRIKQPEGTFLERQFWVE